MDVRTFVNKCPTYCKHKSSLKTLFPVFRLPIHASITRCLLIFHFGEVRIHHIIIFLIR